ncbi:MAG: PfkB family carbohydrate kinase [Clostridiales bacterium]|nr:PfkB family carbohydrate kinase [Clostridiales bacterium]
MCDHGTEYRFKKEWFDALDKDEFACAYICGLEIEEPTGDVIIDFLSESKIPFYFAPGPRINEIEKYKMNRIFSLNPILHVNKREATTFTGTETIREAADKLFELTENDVIITDGDNGSFCLDKCGNWYACEAFKAEVVDTIGAGDSHIGTYIAQRMLGKDITVSLTEANRIASLVVQKEGARLDK